MKKENYSHRGTNTRKKKQRCIEGEQLIPQQQQQNESVTDLQAKYKQDPPSNVTAHSLLHLRPCFLLSVNSFRLFRPVHRNTARFWLDHDYKTCEDQPGEKFQNF